MAENKKFLLDCDSLSVLNILSDEDAGKLIKIIFNYVNGNDLVIEDKLLDIAFVRIKMGIDSYANRNNPGELHWNWKGGVSSENKLIRNGVGIKNWRREVFERDKFTCQECFKVGGTIHAHHIKEFAKYPKLRFEVSNGLTLCKPCHHKTHSKL